MKKRVIAVIAVLALSVAMFGCKAGSDTGNGKKQREESAGDMGTEGKATAEEETEIQESEYSYDGTCKGVSKGSSECEDHIQRG
mgnify:CR=1 FL=1